ncbi:2og-fe oxygenase family protein [Colletotrichum musicola]|uniref:2og-fe oxygenase family protein n=1 Tax=Colletotrichum musicola TaxID=2175873 RepID=A0A8H6K3N9_9PEZI|nr:2og-fe oxygenase family protein [Colletotrichum musicola]
MAAAAEAALPVVDLRSYASIQGLAAELLRVGRDPGFFYVVGHELGDDVAAGMFALAEDFFRSSLEDKLAHANGSGDLGYTGMREETLSGAGPGDVKESFYLSDPGRTTQVLPAQLEAGRERMAAFFAGCDGLARTLLEALAVGLGMPRDYLSKAHTGESCRMRLINYPPVSELPQPQNEVEPEKEDVRAGAHSDYGSLTLLFRQPSDRGGLQVESPGGAWADVPCVKDAVVVNIGDALEFWTAGRLRSTVHRVAFPRSASENVGRLSIPVFVQPDRDVLLEPFRDGGRPAAEDDSEFLEVLVRKGYTSARPVTSWEHLERRIRATYGKGRRKEAAS